MNTQVGNTVKRFPDGDFVKASVMLTHDDMVRLASAGRFGPQWKAGEVARGGEDHKRTAIIDPIHSVEMPLEQEFRAQHLVAALFLDWQLHEEGCIDDGGYAQRKQETKAKLKALLAEPLSKFAELA